MKVIRIEKLPEGYGDYDIAELQPEELARLEGSGIEKLFYWYGSGSYEGAGRALMFDGAAWRYADLGHCSCYGPDEGLIEGRNSKPFADLDAWFNDSTEEWRKEGIQCLIDAIEQEALCSQ